jgi:hypothetical protein
VGKYRVESVQLRLAGDDGRVFSYTFAGGGRGYGAEVLPGRGTAHEPLAGLKLSVTHDAAAGAAPGDSVLAQPDVTAGGLYLTRCEVGTQFAGSGREVAATIDLTRPGGVALDRVSSGFA